MSGYAFDFDGHGTFTPEGRNDAITDTAAHNALVEAEELNAWAAKPDRWHVYVSKHAAGASVTTWLGTELGTIIKSTTYTNNFGSRTTAITLRGTNSATYHGRYGADWSQLCRVRRSKIG